jgi:YD repeat-containing protein
MSFRLDRSLCAACLRLARHRHFYSSQAGLLRVPNSQHSEFSVQQPAVGLNIASVLTSTLKWDQPTQCDPTTPSDATQQTGAENQSEDLSRPRNPLAPNKVDLHLAALHSAKPGPTLADIERCRPQGHSDPSTPQYEQDYNALRDTLCRSFTKSQLRRFAELYHLPKSRSLRKSYIAESIIETQWKWPSLKDIERMKKDTTEMTAKCML